MVKKHSNRNVYIVDGLRTPFLKVRGKPGPFLASDLAVAACQPLIERQNFAATDIEDVVTGCTMPTADEANISRIIALRLGCGRQVPAYTVQRNCGSGMQAIDNAKEGIQSGRYDLVLAGGTEAMSHAPIIFSEKMVNWLARVASTRTFWGRVKAYAGFKPKMLAPIYALLRGLTDPIVGMNMGQTAEKLAYIFGISRLEMDQFAMESHQKLIRAQNEKLLPEVIPIFDHRGNYYELDDGVRRDTTLEKLAKLKPSFDKKYGNVTPGNSSQITDGAAFVILASAHAIKKYNLKVRAKIVDCVWSALDPSIMGLGPAIAGAALLQKQNLRLNDIDYWEMNEAFAAQVLACLKLWANADACREYLQLNEAVGELDRSRLNIHGGGICMGHPISASGARIVVQLMNILEQKRAKRGIACLCIGGGQGGAMLIERTDRVEAGDE